MYIDKKNDFTYNLEMNAAEYQVFKNVFGKLIFNPDGISNYFKMIPEDVEIVRKMDGTMYGVKY
jgi:hypothetical protein